MNKISDSYLLIGLTTLVFLLFIWSIQIGIVSISFSEIMMMLKGEAIENGPKVFIIESRLSRSIVAVLAGGALSLSGLILQVFFRNPLAGPGVLGISSGASLGVAVIVLGGGVFTGYLGHFSTIISGLIGAFLVLVLLLAASKFIRHTVVLLVVGLMFSYFTSAIVNVLYKWASLEETREFVNWGLGAFDSLLREELIVFSIFTIAAILGSFLLIKPLNGLALGSDYAKSLGINMKRTRWIIIILTSILAALVTVYCGPIGFLGIAVPQLTRIITKSKNHLVIIPFTIVLGAILALSADISIRLLGHGIPLNTANSIIGAPIIIWTIIKMNKARK